MKNLFCKTLVGLFLVSLLQIVFSLHAVAVEYTITDLGTLAEHNRSGAYDINNLGHVVGFSDIANTPNGGHAVIWQNGVITDLSSLSTENNPSAAMAINDNGTIVGKIDTGKNLPHPAYGDENGLVELIDTGPVDGGSANGINGSRQIVGTYNYGYESHAFLIENFNPPDDLPYLTSIANVKDLGTLGGSHASALDINVSGQVVGYSSEVEHSPVYAFLWENDQMTKICEYESQANAINDSGQVAGWYYDGSTYQAFLWKDGAMQDLGNGFAYDINSSGQVVGNGDGGPFIWDPVNGMQKLGDMVPNLEGWRALYSASGINDKGQIVGQGLTIDDEYHAFLLTPTHTESISGTVTAIDGTPIPNICVNAHDLACGGTWLGGAQTDANGYYTIPGLPAGDVYIMTHASCITPEYYIDEWWDGGAGTLDCNQAVPVEIVVGGNTPDINFSLEQGGKISGQVTAIGGDGIPNVDVTAFGDKCWGNWSGGNRTDDNGLYTIVVPAGDYYVVAQPSSNQINYLTEWWNEGDGTSDCNQAVLVQVVGGQDTGGIEFALQAGGSVSGTVTVTDSQGDPVPISNLHVHAHSQPCGGDWLGGTDTDVDGSYTLLGMPAGEVYIATCATCSGLTYVDEWYNETYDCNQAAPVEIEVGQETPDINFSLVQGATISGKVTDSSGNTLSNVNVSVSAGDWGMGACTDSQGNYSLTVPPGDYKLSAGGWPCTPDPVTVYALTYYSENDSGIFVGTYNYEEALIFTVGTGDAIIGKNFVLKVGGTISGQVTDSVNGLPNVSVNLHSDNWGMGACTDTSGYYSISGIPPGYDYKLSAGGGSCTPDPVTVYALTYYSENVSGDFVGTYNYEEALIFTVGAGDTIPDKNFVLVVGATISGRVTDSVNGLPNVNVNLHGDNWGMGACTDTSGDYSIIGIPPGTYRVSAGGSNWCGGEVYKQVYYNAQVDWNSADEITLSSGDDISGINFSLELETALSGNISGDPQIGVRNLNVVLHDMDGRLVDWQTTGDQGHYYFSGLKDGEEYKVKVYDPFLNYEYAEEGGLVADTGGQVSADFTLSSYTPSGISPPEINDAMAFIYRSPDGAESLMLTADISDFSGCQPASLKSVTAVGPDGQLHYLYHQKYEALLDQGQSYGEFWYTSRDNTFDDYNTHVGDFIVTALDVNGNRVSSTATLGSYTANKLANPILSSPASGSQVIPSELTLIWNSVSGAAAYQVRIYYLGERIWKSGLITGTSLSIPQSLLSEGRWYRWEVVALDTNNAQFDYYAASAKGSFFVEDETVPSTSSSLSVNIVPWISGSPQIPHDAYAGHQTTFKAVAKGGTPPYTYTWDFGDENSSGDFTTNNAYNLEAIHQYNAASDAEFTAQITVTDFNSNFVSATYPVRFWAHPSRGVMVNVAIDDALWWLHKNMVRFTSAGTDYGYLSPWGHQAGSTALALQAWVLNGHGPGGDPENPYVEDAIRAREYILTQLYPICIGPETVAGDLRDPDFNGNGQGLYVKNGHRLYETGLVLMALATLKDSTLQGTVQDLIDYLAYAQVEADVGGGRGGWRYDANYRESDMSVTQFPLMGLEAAEHHLTGVTIPGYVKTELKDNFLYYVQNKETGGFGYASPDHWLNVAKTGAGLVGLALTGIEYDDQRTTSALGFIDANWLTADPAGPAYNIGDFYAMYAVMKGMKSYEMKGEETTWIGSHDWYNEYADWEIAYQNTDGSWGSPVNSYGPVVDTACGVLILLPQVFAIGPTAVAQASPTSVYVGEEVTFNHSASFHRDSTKEITLYEWDFGDGTLGNTEDLYETFTHSYASTQIYQATLTVTDDSGLTDTDQVTITVSEPAGPVPVIVEIKPETLNLGRNGVFSAYITLGAGSQYVLSDIDPDSLICEGAYVTKSNLAANKLIAKFNSEDLEGVLPGDEVTFKLSGSFNDGTLFEGSDTIRVIEKK